MVFLLLVTFFSTFSPNLQAIENNITVQRNDLMNIARGMYFEIEAEVDDINDFMREYLSVEEKTKSSAREFCLRFIPIVQRGVRLKDKYENFLDVKSLNGDVYLERFNSRVENNKVVIDRSKYSVMNFLRQCDDVNRAFRFGNEATNVSYDDLFKSAKDVGNKFRSFDFTFL